MPLWNVYCTEGTYSKDDKRAFAEAITDIYASEAGGLPEMMMPRFYVVVVFHDVPKDSLFIGGVPRNDFVRFSIDHIAYAMPDEFRELMLKFMNKTIHPFVRDRGLDWEIHIDDTPRRSVDRSGDASSRLRVRGGKALDSGEQAVQANAQRRVDELNPCQPAPRDDRHTWFAAGLRRRRAHGVGAGRCGHGFGRRI